jgi:hypothetical protein
MNRFVFTLSIPHTDMLQSYNYLSDEEPEQLPNSPSVDPNLEVLPTPEELLRFWKSHSEQVSGTSVNGNAKSMNCFLWPSS